MKFLYFLNHFVITQKSLQSDIQIVQLLGQFGYSNSWNIRILSVITIQNYSDTTFSRTNIHIPIFSEIDSPNVHIFSIITIKVLLFRYVQIFFRALYFNLFKPTSKMYEKNKTSAQDRRKHGSQQVQQMKDAAVCRNRQSGSYITTVFITFPVRGQHCAMKNARHNRLASHCHMILWHSFLMEYLRDYLRYGCSLLYNGEIYKIFLNFLRGQL